MTACVCIILWGTNFIRSIILWGTNLNIRAHIFASWRLPDVGLYSVVSVVLLLQCHVWNDTIISLCLYIVETLSRFLSNLSGKCNSLCRLLSLGCSSHLLHSTVFYVNGLILRVADAQTAKDLVFYLQIQLYSFKINKCFVYHVC